MTGGVLVNILKLGDIAEVSTGLVVKRKEAASLELAKKTYKMLTLKSFDSEGWLNESDLDSFNSSEFLEDKYLTGEGDVIVRLSAPYTAITVDSSHGGFLIPSLFAVIRLGAKEFLSEFLALYLNSPQMKKEYTKSSSGSAIQTLKISDFKEFEIKLLPLEEQKKVIDVNSVLKREKYLLLKLLEQNEIRNKEILKTLLNGERK